MALIGEMHYLAIGGNTYSIPVSGGSTVTIERALTSGTKSATISVDGTSYDLYAPTPNAGTVTSVRVQATSPVQSSVSTAQSSTLNTTISLANNYGDTKNPYASKTKNYVLAAPATENGVPSFRALVTADIPDLSDTYATQTDLENLPEPMIFKGSLGTGGTITSLPTAAASNEGYTYKVITAGTYASQSAKVGDTFISDGSAWVLIPSGDEPSGTVTSITLTQGTGITVSNSGTAITTSGSRTISLASITKDDTTSTASPSHGGTFTAIDSITYDTYGRVTGVNTKTVTLPADSNTDTKVTQAYSTTNSNYPILFSATAGISSTSSRGATTAILNNAIYANPSTGNLHVTQLNGVTVGTSPKFTDTTYTNVSEFTNDAGYITSADVPEGASAYTGTISAVSTSASTGTNNGFARGDHVHNITSSTITSALGYTPYDSTNPNGYISSYTDEKLKWTASTSSNTYYPLQSTSTATTSTANTLNGISFYQYYNTAGGYRRLILGNATAYTSTGGAYGTIRLYGTGATYYGDLNPGTLGANRTWTLPNATGTIALTSDIPDVSSFITDAGVTKITTTAGTHSAITNATGAVSFNVPTKTSHLTNDSNFVTSSGVTSITLKAGSGISLDTDDTAITATGTRTISHADTSSQASSSNSGRTYIQSITLDTYGHVTGISTATESVTNTDTKLQVAAVTSGTTYYPIVGTGTTAATRQYDTTGFIYVGTNGTANGTNGNALLTLGNSTASTTANWKKGTIRLYGTTAYYTDLVSGAPSANRTITFPNATGTVALTSDIPDVSSFVTSSGVTSIATTSPISGGTITSTGTISHATSGVGNAVTTAGFYKFKYDTYGHVTGVTSVAASDITGLVTIPTVPSNIVNTITTTAGAHTAITSQKGDVSFSVPTKTSHLTNDSGFLTSDSDEKVKTVALTSGTAYYPVLATGANAAANRQVDSTLDGLKYTSTAGTTSTVGTAILQLGNATASGTANNEQGVIRLYGTTAYYTDIKAESGLPAANRTIYVPSYAGTMYLTCTSTTNAVGGATTAPVYVDNTGCIQAVTSIPYSLLTGTPTIPTKTSHLTNDSGFLTSHQTIKQDGITGATINRYGTCSTAADTAAKTVNITNGTFALEAGAKVAVYFQNKNTAAAPTLNVNSTGAKNIVYYDGQSGKLNAATWQVYGMVELVYDGTYWQFANNPSPLLLTTYNSTNSGYIPIIASTTGGYIRYNSNISISNGKLGSSALPMALYNSAGAIMPAYSTTETATLTTAAASNNSSPTIAAKTTTSNRYYGVEIDNNGVLFVNVPWTNVNSSYLTASSTLDANKLSGTIPTGCYTNTTYSAGTGLSLSSGAFSVKLGYTTSGNNRAVQADSSGNLYVVQTDTNTHVTQTASTTAAWRKVLGTANSGVEATSTIANGSSDVVYYDADGPAFNTSTGELYTKGYSMYLATTDALYTAINDLGWVSDVIS